MAERLAGLLLPAFSIRREGDLGIGDTRGLIEWLGLAAERGVGFLQLLPINETGSDDSPYNAISSVALEPLYLACEEIPGIGAREVAAARKSVREGGAVDYRNVRAVKGGLLAKAWQRWGRASAKLKEEFAGFREKEAAWLDDYCVYRWLMEQVGGNECWDQWPKSRRTVSGARRFLEDARQRDAGGVEASLACFAWIQWLCFRQWRGVRKVADAKGVELMGDIPIGVSRYSADVFFRREDFDLDWCGGAPPETMFKHDAFIRKWGQNWGIPLYRWDKMEREGFPWWRQRIDKLTDLFHIFRIDHVLGFYRIYAFPWRPERNGEFLELSKKQAAKITGGDLPGWSPRPDNNKKNRALNRDDGDRRLRVILEAAGDAAVVGEDLGCVPEYVRPHLQSLGIAGFRVPHWDHDAEGHVIPGEDFPECSFATYATHDHEPLAAMWEDYRAQLGDPDPDEAADAAAQLRRLSEFAGIAKPGRFGVTVQWKLIGALLASRSRYAAILINDLFGTRDRINRPGTVGPENWSYRLPGTAAEHAHDEAWVRWMRVVRKTERG